MTRYFRCLLWITIVLFRSGFVSAFTVPHRQVDAALLPTKISVPKPPASTTSINKSPLFAKGVSSFGTPSPASMLLAESSLQLKRLSWFSWWSQVILSTIAAVILVFAKNVSQTSSSAGVTPAPLNLVLSSVGVLVSGVSILWTWGNGARLSRRILKGNIPTAARLLSKAIRIQVTFNLIGLLGSVLAAQQIVGTLAIKVLTRQPSSIVNSLEGSLQPLDILVVQANNNTLLSHLISLVCSLMLTKLVRRMNPLPERE